MRITSLVVAATLVSLGACGAGQRGHPLLHRHRAGLRLKGTPLDPSSSPLQLPRIFHGRYRDVRPRLMRVARRAARGQDWVAEVERHGFLDVAETPGYIVADGPSSLLGRDEHFQMWFLWTRIWEGERVYTTGIADRIFQESLAHPWGVLGLCMRRNDMWVASLDGKDEPFHATRQDPLLRAASRHWERFAAVGPRYTSGSRMAKELWNASTTITLIFARRGLPLEFLKTPPRPGAFARLLDEHGILREPAGTGTER